MSMLLIPESPLQVLPMLATKIGLNEAIFIQQLHWLAQQKHMGKMADGRKWVRNSLTDWHQQFPFFSVPMLRRIIKNLQKDGLLLYREDLNSHAYDKTGWYAVDFVAVQGLDGMVERLEEINKKRREAIMKRYDDESAPLQVVTPLQDEIGQGTKSNGGDYKMHTTIPKTSSKISSKNPPAGENVAVKGAMVNALVDATGISGLLNWNVLSPLADELIAANYTPEQVTAAYGPGGYWKVQDWRGQKGDFPSVNDVRETILRATQWEPKRKNGNGNGHRKTAVPTPSTGEYGGII